MADNVQLPVTGTGTADVVAATDDVTGVHYPFVKLVDGTLGGTDKIGGDATNGLDVDVTRLPALATGSNVIGQTFGAFVTCSTDVTRPGDTTTYVPNDALSDSTTAPTTGGFTFTNAARQSGGSGIITDAFFASNNDPATTLSGELFIFNQAVTNINDNAAFAVSDTEIKTCVAKIPFTLEDVGNNGYYHAQNLAIGFTCSGSANLRFLVRVKNGYAPANAEVITFGIKVLQVT